MGKKWGFHGAHFCAKLMHIDGEKRGNGKIPGFSPFRLSKLKRNCHIYFKFSWEFAGEKTGISRGKLLSCHDGDFTGQLWNHGDMTGKQWGFHGDKFGVSTTDDGDFTGHNISENKTGI